MADGLPAWAEPVEEQKLKALPDWAEAAAPEQERPPLQPPQPTAGDNLLQGQQIKPEEAAKALKLGPRTGTPPSTVALDPKGYQQDADQRDAVAAVEANPNIRNYVQKSSLNAAVSQGDYPALDRASKSISELEPERMQNATFGRLMLEALKHSPAGRFAGFQAESARLFSQGMLTGIGGSLKGLAESVETAPAASPLYL